MVERDKFEWNNFCCMDKCLNTIFFLPPQQFPRRKTIVVTILFFDKKKSQWPTSRSQTTPAWHACQAAQQSAFGTTDPKYTMSMRTSWIEGSSCRQTAHNRGQVCSQRTKCFGSQSSQLRSTMAWHKMECHNALMAAYANNQVGISWSFCPAWRRPCVSPLITWVRNTWLAQWKSMWWDLTHKKSISATMWDNAKWATSNVATVYNSYKSWRPTSMSWAQWRRTIYVSCPWTSTQQWSSTRIAGTMTLSGILDMQSISRASYYNGKSSPRTKETISSTIQSYACALTTLVWKAQASYQWKYKSWSNNSGSTIAWTPTSWTDNWNHNVDTEATSNGSLTHKANKKMESMKMTMAMMDKTMMMQWEDQRRGRLTIEMNNVNNEFSYYKMESCCNNPPSETHATHNIAQRVDKLGWAATMKSWTMHESLYRWQFRLWKISWTKTMSLEWFCLTIWVDVQLISIMYFCISRVFENNAVLQQSEGRC